MEQLLAQEQEMFSATVKWQKHLFHNTNVATTTYLLI